MAVESKELAPDEIGNPKPPKKIAGMYFFFFLYIIQYFVDISF